MEERPRLSWEWKVIEFPTNKKNEVLGDKMDNDYAARVYVMFKGSTILTSEVIQYIWDDHFEEGEWRDSPYSSRVKLLVVEKGISDNDDGWVAEERDLYEDYRFLFGKAPSKPLSAVGVGSDSDDTKSTSIVLITGLTVTATPGTQAEKTSTPGGNIQPKNRNE